jgi:hypothetical protein
LVLHGIEEARAAGLALRVDVRRRGEAGHGVAGTPVFVEEKQRVEARTEKAGVLTAPHGVVLVADGARQLHRRREAVAVAAELPNHRAHAGRILPIELRLAGAARRMPQAGEIVMDADAVRVGAVIHRTQDRIAMRLAGEQRQKLADLRAVPTRGRDAWAAARSNSASARPSPIGESKPARKKVRRFMGGLFGRRPGVGFLVQSIPIHDEVQGLANGTSHSDFRGACSLAVSRETLRETASDYIACQVFFGQTEFVGIWYGVMVRSSALAMTRILRATAIRALREARPRPLRVA